MKELMRVLKALADPNRMRIVKMLQRREMCVCELTEALGIAQPSVSRHMKLLEDADLVTHRREGQWIHYRLIRASQNPYARALVKQARNWLEEDPEMQALLGKASSLDREQICRGRPSQTRSPVLAEPRR